MPYLTTLVTADLRSARNRFTRGGWGERFGALAATLVVALFCWGCHSFFLRIFESCAQNPRIDDLGR